MRRTVKIALEALGLLIAGLALAIVLLAWRLSTGPLEIDFLTPYIQDALADQPVRIEIGSTALRWDGFSRPFTVVARDVRIASLDGRPIASVPEISADLSLPKLLRGMIAPSRIDLVGPRVRILRLENGDFALDIATETTAAGAMAPPPEVTTPGPATGPDAVAPPEPDDPLPQMLAALDQAPSHADSPLAALRELTVIDAEIVLIDRVLDRRWVAPTAAVTLRRTETGVAGDASVDVDLGDHTSHLAFESAYVRDTRRTSISVGFTDIVPAELTRISTVLAPLEAIRSAVSGRVDMMFDRDFHPTGATFKLFSQETLLNLPALWPEPLVAGRTSIEGRFDMVQRKLELSDVSMDFGGPVLSLTVEVDQGPDGTVDAFLAGGLTNLPIDQLDQVWPAGVAAGGRRWVTRNLHHGTMRYLTISLHVRAPGGDLGAAELVRVDGSIGASGVEMTYLEGLPAATDVSASSVFDGQSMRIDVEGGTLRGLALLPSKVVMSGLDGDDQNIAIDTALAGPVRDLLEILDMPKLGYPSRVGIVPARSGGEAGVRLHFAFPLVDAISIDAVGLSGNVNLRGMSIADFKPGLDITDGSGSLEFDGRGLTLDGRASVNGVPAQLTWREEFAGRGGTHLTAEARLTDAARTALGMGSIGAVSGPIGMKADYRAVPGAAATLTAALDLTDAQFRLPVIEWTKAAGSPSTADLTASVSRGRITGIGSFRLSGSGLDAAGSAVLTESGGLSRLVLDRLSVAGQDLAGTIAQADDGGWDVSLTGSRLDMTPFMADDAPAGATGPAPAAAASGPPIRLALDVGTLALAPGRQLAGVRGSLSGRAGDWRTIDLTAAPPGGGTLTLMLQPEGAKQRLTLRSDNAGGVLRVFDITDTIQGGALALDGISDNGTVGPINGTMTVSDFILSDVPAMARLLSMTSPIGLFQSFETEGMQFSKLVADVTYFDAPQLVVLRNGVASGADLGLTFDGRIGIDAKTIDIAGTVAPLDTLSDIVGAIPIIGDVLTGGNGGGILAFTYTVQGSFASPAVSVNPLSVLAPGIIRRLLFESTPSAQ